VHAATIAQSGRPIVARARVVEVADPAPQC
jgi:hypothetical protein